MKIELTKNEIVNRIYNDDYNDLSYEASRAIADYLEELEEETGQELEFDLCMIRGQFSEYEDYLDLNNDIRIVSDTELEGLEDDEKEYSIKKALEIEGYQVIHFKNGIILIY